MSVTNAISGMTAAGGMLIMGGGLLPGNTAQALGAAAVALSSVNLAGGFILTNRMLEMFRRPTDPPEYTHYYFVPAAVSVGGYFATKAIGVDTVGMAYVASGVMCIGGIAAMSDMKTSRIANPIAMMGVTTGLAATLGAIQQTPEVYAQIAACTGIGAAAGFSIARGLAPTQLPETVALFHSLVGAAAVTTSIGSYMMDPHHAATAWIGTFIGAVTVTGSLVAYGKLAGKLDSGALALPGKDAINIGMLSANLACLGCVTSETRTPS
jgi:NAD(P) transhydrogenase